MLTEVVDRDMFVVVLGILVAATALLCALDKSNFNGLDDEDGFLDVVLNRFYFAITTISTVGYGDVTPKSRIAKCLSMVLQTSILLAFSEKLVDVIRKTSS